MTMPAFGGPGFGGGPMGMGYTGGPIYGPMNSAPKFEPVIYAPLSAPRFEPRITHICEAPSYKNIMDKVELRLENFFENVSSKLESTISDSLGTFRDVIQVESTIPKKDYGIFNDAYGITPNGRIRHLLDY